MCGIIGIVTKQSKNYEQELGSAISSLKHRGPDGNGSHFFDNCALGHTRLSIIDLSTGTQPMLSIDNKLGVTFNGEIYGYKELKKELIDYSFKTSSDTEVILALYHKYHDGMMEKLPGMFSFAVWDEDRQSLFCARDRFGEKPFYYAIGQKGEFVFASEIKAILATGLIKPILNQDAITDYLKHLYINTHQTIYQNIHTLPPAHYLIFKDNQVIVKRYWELPKINTDINLPTAIDKFKELLKQAVTRQLVADVPVGAFLSGGLDSATIVATASQLKNKLQTYSFGFGESINELPLAKLTAEKYNTTHTELRAENYNLAELFLKMQEVYDEPFADSSNIPTYLLTKEAQKYNKVVLTGDGGDEMFGGYSSWYKPLFYQLEPIYRNIAYILKNIFSVWSPSIRLDLYYRLKGLSNKILGKEIVEVHAKKHAYFSDAELEKLVGEKIVEDKMSGMEKTLNEIIRHDVTNYMPGDILTKIDRAAMANGLELRSPFLDVDFATFCLSLPTKFKIGDNTDKIILRRAMASNWPLKIQKRSKQGFGSPVSEWLSLPSFKELKKQYLCDDSKKIFKLLNYKACQKTIKKDNYQTWILLTLSVWLEKHEFDLIK